MTGTLTGTLAWPAGKAADVSLAEARAREAVDRFEGALDRQWRAVEARSWPHAPKHIREAHGDPSLPDPPSREAMDAWTTLLVDRRHSLWRCQENLKRGQDAVHGDLAQAEVYWKRATSAAGRALAELGDRPDGVEPEAASASGEQVSAEQTFARESTAQHVRSVQILLFLGWMPTGLTAIISGVIVGFLTGNIGSAVVVVVGGTLVGWIAMLLLIFTVGNDLEQNRSIGRPGVFEAISVVFGIIVTIAFAAYIA